MSEVLVNQITTGQTFMAENVLSYRFQAPAQSINSRLLELDNFIKHNNLAKSGYTTTATHSVQLEDGVQIIDMEIKIPLSEVVEASKDFVFSPEFRIENAVKISYEGNPNNMRETINALGEFIKSNNLNPNTPMYTVTVREAKTPAEAENMLMDIYVGVAQ